MRDRLTEKLGYILFEASSLSPSYVAGRTNLEVTGVDDLPYTSIPDPFGSSTYVLFSRSSYRGIDGGFAIAIHSSSPSVLHLAIEEDIYVDSERLHRRIC